MQTPEYREVFAISQSAIKAFKTKPLQKFKEIYIDKKEEDSPESDAIAFGSLVDTLIFSPNLVDKRFFIPDGNVPIPGDKVKEIVDKVYKEAAEVNENKRILNAQGNIPELLEVRDITSLDNFNDLIIKYAREIKFGGTTWKDTRILDTVINDGYYYFQTLGKANGRTVISLRDNLEAIEVRDALLKDTHTAPYFTPLEGEELLFQEEIFMQWSYADILIPLKGALDIIRINHNEKWVQVPDLKTTYDVNNFRNKAKDFDYLNQASFYNFLIYQFLKEYKGGICREYEVKTPINIAIDRDYKIPYIYEYDPNDIIIAQEGKEGMKGWAQLLDDIGWHIKTNKWDKPRELYENGVIKLKFYND